MEPGLAKSESAVIVPKRPVVMARAWGEAEGLGRGLGEGQ